MADTTKVDLRNTVGYRGQLYGPGKGVEVPKALAYGLGLRESTSMRLSGTADELDAQYSKQELEDEAKARGLTVKRSDGKDGALRKEDLVAALASGD
jgi:hypothetical protein